MGVCSCCGVRDSVYRKQGHDPECHWYKPVIPNRIKKMHEKYIIELMKNKHLLDPLILRHIILGMKNQLSYLEIELYSRLEDKINNHIKAYNCRNAMAMNVLNKGLGDLRVKED